MTVRPLVKFPNAERLLVDALDVRLVEPVRTDIPNPRPASFVTVRRIGGQRRSDVVDDATIAVECWAPTPTAAEDLAQRCRAYFHALTGQQDGGVSVYRTGEFGGPVNLPDPDSRQPRYTFTATVQLRGAQLH